MAQITTLYIAKICCRAFIVCLYIAFGALTVFFIHWQINPDFYSGVEINVPEDAFYSRVYSTYPVEGGADITPHGFHLNELKRTSAVVNYGRISGLLFVLYLLLKECLHIITSVESLQTFKKGNVDSFRKIGRYCLLYFILEGICDMEVEHGFLFSLSANFAPLILMLAAFIMSEVFKQGNTLLEENTLTI